MSDTTVHLVEPEQAVRPGRYVRAACGVLVRRDEGRGQQPTCDECLDLAAKRADETPSRFGGEQEHTR